MDPGIVLAPTLADMEKLARQALTRPPQLPREEAMAMVQSKGKCLVVCGCGVGYRRSSLPLNGSQDVSLEVAGLLAGESRNHAVDVPYVLK
jgi:hypothetical protein